MQESNVKEQKKFENYLKTVNDEDRAYVDMTQLDTLWINSGTLCNIECVNCYIESSPKNDRLVYITYDEVCTYLNEIESEKMGTREVGITGGEPFMNRDMIKIVEECLKRGFETIVLTNAMQPMQRKMVSERLLELKEAYKSQLTMRVSVDHFKQDMHEQERGKGTWAPMLKGLKWLSDNGFNIDIAGRTRWGEKEEELRDGFNALFQDNNIKLDAHDQKQLVLFPEMDEDVEVPEITTDCWDVLNVKPQEIMCSNSRMVVKRKGADKPAVIACTLLPYEDEFEFESTLKDSAKRVYLNHPHCSKFCVLGGGACSVSDNEK